MPSPVADVWRTHVSRFPIAMTAVTLGALAVSTAAVIGAFVVIDGRAAQVLKSEPRVVPAAQKRAPSADASRMSRGGGASQAARGSLGSRTEPATPRKAETVGTAAAGPRVAAPPQVPRQAMVGETSRPPDTVRDSDTKRTDAHHRTTRHDRQSARRPAHEPPVPEPPAPAPPSPAPQDGNRSAFFFPFR
jgi:hypothetical protein